MRAVILAAAVLTGGGAASAQEPDTHEQKRAVTSAAASASDWRVVECRRGADAKRAVRREFGRMQYVKARDVLAGPRFEGPRCMSELEYWRLGRALDMPRTGQLASMR